MTNRNVSFYKLLFFVVCLSISFLIVAGLTQSVLSFLFSNYLARVLCLSWKSCGKILVCGGSGYISTLNFETGELLNRITVGGRAKKQNVFVWSLVVLDDFTIVSGDSRYVDMAVLEENEEG